MMTLEQVYAKLRNACIAAGGQSEWAKSVGLSPAYVSDVVNARRDPGPSILSALGVKRVVTYVPVRV